MVALGYVLLVAGLAIGLVGEVMFLTITYKRGLVWFFCCLFIPVVWLIFFLLNFKATIKSVALSLLGLLLAGVGSWMAGVVWPR